MEGVVEIAASILFWRHQNSNMSSNGEELQGVTTNAKISNPSGDLSEPLQNKILRIITSRAKGAAKWKALLTRRKIRAASAVHHVNCLHSTNSGTIPLVKFRGNDNSFEGNKNLVRHVVKCTQNRQIRHSEHLSTLSGVATEATEKVMGG